MVTSAYVSNLILYHSLPHALSTATFFIPLFLKYGHSIFVCTIFFCYIMITDTCRADYFIKVSLKLVIPSQRPSLIIHTKVNSFTHYPRHLSLFAMILFIYLTICLSVFFCGKKNLVYFVIAVLSAQDSNECIWAFIKYLLNRVIRFISFKKQNK